MKGYTSLEAYNQSLGFSKQANCSMSVSVPLIFLMLLHLQHHKYHPASSFWQDKVYGWDSCKRLVLWLCSVIIKQTHVIRCMNLAQVFTTKSGVAIDTSTAVHTLNSRHLRRQGGKHAKQYGHLPCSLISFTSPSLIALTTLSPMYSIVSHHQPIS